MARKPKRIKLTQEQRATLQMWSKSGKTEQRMATRARVILLASEGKSISEIASEVRLSPQNTGKWRKRFESEGIEGLKDRKGRGKKPEILPETRAKVIELACSKPEDGSNAWSCRKIADKLGIGKTTVNRILREGEIKPHKVEYWCGKSTDPEFEKKAAEIIGLYLNPPDKALVLSVDEKSQVQALDRTQPALPIKAGQVKRLTNTYKRNGTTCLLAALSVHEGTVDARCVQRQTHKEILGFLKHIYRKYPGRQLHVIMDNLSAHKHGAVKEWVKKRRRLTIHYTPTYSSWLNQIEIWFSIFSRDVLKGGVWKSKKELIDQIMHYIKVYNEERAKPFEWTYTGKPLVA